MKVQWATNLYSTGVRLPHLQTAAEPAADGRLALRTVTTPVPPSPYLKQCAAPARWYGALLVSNTGNLQSIRLQRIASR